VKRPDLVKAGALVSTVVLSWAALSYGVNEQALELQVGAIAETDFFAQRSAEVVDVVRTEEARDAAAEAVELEYTRQLDIEADARNGIDALFATVRNGVASPAPPTTTTTTTTTTEPETTTTIPTGEEGEGETTETTVPPLQTALLQGTVFLDVDGDGLLGLEPGELGIAETGAAGVPVTVRVGPDEFATATSLDGGYRLTVTAGDAEVTVVPPTGLLAQFRTSGAGEPATVACPADSVCDVPAIGLTALVRSLEAQSGDLRVAYATLDDDSVQTLVTTATGDVYRDIQGTSPRLVLIQTQALQRIEDSFDRGIYSSEDLIAERGQVVNSPPLVFNEDGTRDLEAGAAAADVVNLFLQQNWTVDEVATEAARQAARDATPEVTVSYLPGSRIISQGEPLTQLAIDAIEATGSPADLAISELAMGAVLAVLVAVLAYYLARFRPEFWRRPQMVTLFGVLIILGAVAVRATGAVSDQASWYVLPGVMFGYLAAVLFDNRMGTLMALALGILAAVGTRDPAMAVYATLATLTPIGFVSAVSSRRAFRNSVVVSAAAVAVIAATVAWFFDVGVNESVATVVREAAAWGFGASLIAALVALAAMPFFESVFDVTTTLRLLELTDRNHEALVLIQEEAFGTFNHSLMVGTLADAAAKAIGANNLLARAAAYYHDIGKTENPVYFIENQFGIPNPHDDLSPAESAEIVRRHVIDGVELARRYKIPSEVAEGIVCHHGDAIMRYFYEKARVQATDGTVDPDLYRHAGHKPRSKEMAILMLADSVEGACRAVFSEEEPTPDGIAKVVTRVVDEKVGDGQLSVSDLTQSDLTRVQQAFVEAMIGHYHSRIPYPNFPGS
jgi:putative nucleotidyltransferase with HDIG domain